MGAPSYPKFSSIMFQVQRISVMLLLTILGTASAFNIGQLVRVVKYPGQPNPGRIWQIASYRYHSSTTEYCTTGFYVYTLYGLHENEEFKYGVELNTGTVRSENGTVMKEFPEIIISPLTELNANEEYLRFYAALPGTLRNLEANIQKSKW